jgi:hypothetical protein
VAAVQYTFTHKQYVEQHNETDIQNRTFITIRIHKVKLKQSPYRPGVAQRVPGS